MKLTSFSTTRFIFLYTNQDYFFWGGGGGGGGILKTKTVAQLVEFVTLDEEATGSNSLLGTVWCP